MIGISSSRQLLSYSSYNKVEKWPLKKKFTDLNFDKNSSKYFLFLVYIKENLICFVSKGNTYVIYSTRGNLATSMRGDLERSVLFTSMII